MIHDKNSIPISDLRFELCVDRVYLSGFWRLKKGILIRLLRPHDSYFSSVETTEKYQTVDHVTKSDLINETG